MDIFSHTIKSAQQILSELKVKEVSGLSGDEVKARLIKYGGNTLEVREVRWWHVLLRQFKSAFIYLLVAAIIITFFLGERLDSAMILLFLAINAGLGFYQEYRSEKTAQPFYSLGCHFLPYW